MTSVRCYDALEKHGTAISVALPAGVALGLGLWRVGTPSYWRDESVTVVAAGGSLPDLAGFVREMDAVHALYYLFMHAVMVLGDGEMITRLPSVLASALTAAGIVLIGRRLPGLGTAWGCAAGLLYAVLPVVSQYAQEARSYALVGAAAVLATWLLLRALDEDRGWVAYSAALTLLGWLHLYGLFLVAAHAVPVLHNRHNGRKWIIAVLAAFAMVAPLAAFALSQSEQVAWIPAPDATAVPGFAKFVFGGPLLALFMAPLLVLGLTGRARVVWLPWLVVPPVLMLGLSYAGLPYLHRYALFCVPALALGTAAGLARLTTRSPAVACGAVATIAAAVLPAQLSLRTTIKGGDDLRTLASLVRERAEPGDAVLYLPTSRAHFAAAYQGATGLPAVRFRSAATRPGRLWVVEVPPPARPLGPRSTQRLAGLRSERRPADRWTFGSIRLSLYERPTR